MPPDESFSLSPGFSSAADARGITRIAGLETAREARDSAGRIPVTVVVPCFNEEAALPFLRERLCSLRECLAGRYDLALILVDDASTDHTWSTMQQRFGKDPNCRCLRHSANRGVAAAILTGIRGAETEIVSSLDCDCSYDPAQLATMLPKLVPGVDLVTGSPYHPEGAVVDVPGWRLTLSRAASFLYRRILRHRLYTYTSCFRVYRRSAILGLDLKEDGFLGIAELLAKLDLQKSAIVEHPARLEVRRLGTSKMKTARVAFGHLRLLAEIAAARLGQRLRQQTAPVSRTSEIG